MKKVALFLIMAIVISSSALTVNAHPGRTDGAGGHYVAATGEYHYHHGYPPHDHEDGVCPYDSEDVTVHSDVPQSESWNEETVGNVNVTEEVENVQRSPLFVSENVLTVIAVTTVTLTLLLFIIAVLCFLRSRRRRKEK